MKASLLSFTRFAPQQLVQEIVVEGKEAMLGKMGVVIKDIAPEGKIRYATEIWNARTDGRRFSAGEKVIIHGFLEMYVLVKEAPAEAP